MNFRIILLGVVAALCTAPSAHAQRNAPDLILMGGRVFTADSARPWAEAIAIRGERIQAVGTTAEIEALAARGTRRIALGGRLVIPGFNDAHAHISAGVGGVDFATGATPTPDPTIAVVADSLRALVKRTPRGTLLTTDIGEAILGDSTARRAALDRVAPNHPVIISGWSGHGAVLNSAAIRLVKLDTTADPLGGWLERDANGRFTGRIDEYAKYNIFRKLAIARGAAPLVGAMRKYDETAALFGITSVQNMSTGISPATLAAASRAKALRIRHRLVPVQMTQVGTRDRAWPKVRGLGARTRVSGAKFILDGTPIERLALMREPYFDRAGWYGRTNFSLDSIKVLLREALATGQQPMLHTVGDSSIALALTAMRAVAADSTWRRVRLRLEHADNLMPDQFAAVRQLGIIVVQNPVHLALAFGGTRWSTTRAERSELLRGILEAGIPLAIGSDAPPNPFVNLMFAVMNPANPAHALTLEQAVVAHTLTSAYAEHMERDKGSLVPGKLADIAVLSQDVFRTPLQALPGTTSVLTLVGGKVTRNVLP